LVENTERIEAEVDIGYEFYQIIKDFDNPIQIFREAFQNSVDEFATEVHCKVSIEQRLGREDLFIDIWDNGSGLIVENISAFFGLAKSTKINADKTPIGKLGYKGHGTKIYFNSEQIEIFSKPDREGEGWARVLDDPIKQIREHNTFYYTKQISPKDCSISLPPEFKTGFCVRIKNPYHFQTQNTRFMLNHVYLRDYTNWFTVFGSIRPLFDDIPPVTLYLHGLNIDHFKREASDFGQIDPLPEFVEGEHDIFEKIQMGHYFPESRNEDTPMEEYGKKIDPAKPYSDYYSNQVLKERVYLETGSYFDFIVYLEGYETKRRYDILLSRRGKSPFAGNMEHTDAERYGLWACKGGIPIEKVDEWVKGRGVGTYTYMHAFIDCDNFELTANRGSIKNSDLEIIAQVKNKLSEILSSNKIQDIMKQRDDWEEAAKTQRTLAQDEKELKQRFKSSINKKYILLPNGFKIPEPTKMKGGGYSESETLIVLIELLTLYPNLFPFKILDYNTNKGIDFVVEKLGNPSYIELKGTFQKKINHSFRHIYKFICYELDRVHGDKVEDVENLNARLEVTKDDYFESPNDKFNRKKFTSYQLQPTHSSFQSMEVIVLKEFLSEVIEVTFSS